MTRPIRHAIALACLAAASASANANLVFADFAHGSETVNFAITGSGGNASGFVNAGGFTVSMDGSPGFAAYCIDLFQTIAFGGAGFSDYTLVAGSAYPFANTNAVADIGKLFSAGHLVNDAKSEAAFQIAVWELAYETSGTYALGAGNALFSGGSAATAGALALAGGWLAGLATGVNTYAVDVLASPLHQDQVFATPQITFGPNAIPEPATTALMLAGLVGLGLARRRRAD